MSATYATEPRDTRAFKASQRSGHARRFRTAMRHSRRVRLLRVGLPAAAILGVVVLGLVTWFNPLRILTNLPISVGNVVVSGSKIKMENPKMSGFTRDKRRYDVTANAAAQDLTQPGVIELEDISANFEMQDKSTMKVVAQGGLFNTNKEQLTLERDIVVTSSKGDEGYFEEAVVDTKSGNVVSEKPMRLKMSNGTVKANRFELTESGNLIRFDKGVVVNTRLDSPKPAATTP